jgi:uncharacterized protein YhaN
MKLKRITIRRMPGIDDEFTLESLSPGLNLVVGPNGSGKSTLCRAARALLWPGVESPKPVFVFSDWSDGDSSLRAERENDQVRWQRDGIDGGAPAVPDEQLAGCFNLGVRDLLLDERETDAGIAAEILRQMSGGYDVGAVREQLFASRPRLGQHEQARLRETERRLTSVKKEYAGLAASEARLGEIVDDLELARQAGRRLEALQQVAELARDRGRLVELERELESYPPEMSNLLGNEAERLAQIESDLAAAREELEQSRSTVEQAVRQIERCRLKEDPPDNAILNTQVARARELVDVEREIRNTLSELAATEGRLEEARQQLGAQADPEWIIRLDPGSLSMVDSFLSESGRLRERRAWLEARREAFDRAEPAVGIRSLERAAEALRGWLAVSRSGGGARVLGTTLAGGSALAAGAVLGLLVHWAGWILAGAGLGALLALPVLSRFGSGATARAMRREFRDTGLEPPAAWKRDEVRERAIALEEELAAARLHQQRQEAVNDLERELQRLEQEEREHEAGRESIRATLGIDPGRPDLDLAIIARQVVEYRRIHAESRATQAGLSRRREGHAESLDELNRFLEQHGAAAGSDAQAVSAAIEDLKDRCRNHREARDRRQSEAQRGRRLEERCADLERRRSELFQVAGLQPGDEQELERRLRRFDAFQALDEKRRRCHASVRAAEDRLHAEGELSQLSVEELEQRSEELREGAARRDELSEEIGAIRGAVRQARSNDRLERLFAATAAARGELEDRRAEKLRRAAGALLIDAVREDYDRQSRPAVLERAAEMFGRFTANEYRLLFDSTGGQPAFSALEASSGQGRSLSALSEGTRIQLLLAARLAFATHAGRGHGVPFFLDEVLTTSDPRRFAAVARSLLVLVHEENRQVFYLTSDPADAKRWNQVLAAAGRDPVEPLDLAAVRQRQTAAAEIEELVPPLPDRAPSPHGISAEEYGRQLLVEPVQPHRDVSRLHLFHLLHEDLGLLHELVQADATNVGRWRNLARGGETGKLFGAGRAARVSALCDLAEAFFEAWRIGRGTKIDVEVLRAAGVSETYLQRLGPLVDELDGDARRLLVTIERREDERVKRFRADTMEQLTGYLESHGYVDPREPLDEAAIVARVLSALAEHVEARRLSTAEVAIRVRGLHAAAKRGASEAGGGRDDLGDAESVTL